MKTNSIVTLCVFVNITSLHWCQQQCQCQCWWFMWLSTSVVTTYLWWEPVGMAGVTNMAHKW